MQSIRKKIMQVRVTPVDFAELTSRHSNNPSGLTNLQYQALTDT